MLILIEYGVFANRSLFVLGANSLSALRNESKFCYFYNDMLWPKKFYIMIPVDICLFPV